MLKNKIKRNEREEKIEMITSELEVIIRDKLDMPHRCMLDVIIKNIKELKDL